ncbi:MAG: DUF1844 domain-containing protein [Anaeromyxobacteraceae bacterium]|nr:DUF1844 domain-containing protein [Anaeromyxobacteraceae bacterium]
MDFFTFILGLGSSAFVHLGDAPHPETGQAAAPDLALAQQTIDVLAMLAEKTKGNLTPQEDALMGQLLRDLRLRFVERSRG